MDKQAVDGRHKKCNWTLSKLLKSVSGRQEKVELISEQHSQDEKTEKATANYSFENVS